MGKFLGVNKEQKKSEHKTDPCGTPADATLYCPLVKNIIESKEMNYSSY